MNSWAGGTGNQQDSFSDLLTEVQCSWLRWVSLCLKKMGIKDQELEVHLYLRAGNDLVLWLVLCNMKSM